MNSPSSDAEATPPIPTGASLFGSYCYYGTTGGGRRRRRRHAVGKVGKVGASAPGFFISVRTCTYVRVIRNSLHMYYCTVMP